MRLGTCSNPPARNKGLERAVFSHSAGACPHQTCHPERRLARIFFPSRSANRASRLNLRGEGASRNRRVSLRFFRSSPSAEISHRRAFEKNRTDLLVIVGGSTGKICSFVRV